MSRLTPFFGAALIALGTGIAQAHDVAGAQAAVPISGAAAPVYEYVQQATAMAYDGTNMTLQGIAPSTVFFSDRPYRLSGQVPNETFVNLWNAPDGTFAGDPPNAAVTVLSETDLPPVIVELTSAKVDGASLQYGVKVISGELPDNASNVAVFIDHGSGFGGGGMPGGGGFHGGGGGMPGGGFHGGGSFHGGGGLHGGGGFHGGGGGIPGGGGFHGGGDSMPGGGHFHHGGFHGGGHANSDYHGGGTHPHNHHQHHDHHHHSQTGANNGPYCDHAPQDPQCHNFNPYPPSPPPHAYGPDYPYGPQGPYVPYDPAAAAATGATAGAAAADPDDRRTYKYPIPAGPIPKHCHININHTRMICTVPQN